MTVLQVLGDADTVLAFALGGVAGRIVHAAADARAAIAEAIDAMRAEEASGTIVPCLLVITTRVADLARDLVDAAVLDTRGPLVIEIPGFGDEPGGDPVGHFVERVLGVQL
ncbi:hypothetical protein L6Q96_14820 [Candidatus Binatia bacterium]|nr:hypothetical protein [Candidatus Binatia bacterium]